MKRKKNSKEIEKEIQRLKELKKSVLAQERNDNKKYNKLNAQLIGTFVINLTGLKWDNINYKDLIEILSKIDIEKISTKEGSSKEKYSELKIVLKNKVDSKKQISNKTN